MRHYLEKKPTTEKSFLYDELRKRKEQLESIMEHTQESLNDAPEGGIRCAYSIANNRMQYFWRKDAKDKWGQYIKKDYRDIIPKLLQKKYNKNIMKLAEKELADINTFLEKHDKDMLIEEFKNMHEKNRSMVAPVIYDDETYATLWQNKSFESKSFRDSDSTTYYTKRGERVRSKSEILIANALFDAGIPYRYEYPVSLKNGIVVHPDFTVLNKKTRKVYYWEHWGRLDDRDYVKDNLKKISQYSQVGIVQGNNLLITFETSNSPLSTKDIQAMLALLFL